MEQEIQVRSCIPVIPEPGYLKQEHCKFKACLRYKASSYLKRRKGERGKRLGNRSPDWLSNMPCVTQLVSEEPTAEPRLSSPLERDVNLRKLE